MEKWRKKSQKYGFGQTCRNPGIFANNIDDIIKLSANIATFWNSRFPFSEVSASIRMRSHEK